MIKDIETLTNKIYKHREYLHEIAEVGRKEFKTSNYIKDYLDDLNINYDTYLGTDIVGTIKGKMSNKTVAFRSDIDGLPTECGVKHLCGHDGHMSILLGLVEFINDNKEELNENIVFIFQPAEEGPGGAEELIKAGIIDKYNIDEIYGLHVYPEVEEGYIGIRPGYFMAQAGDLDIEIISKGGHGAMPQTSIDAVVIVANLISNLETIVSRNISPLENAVLTIGKINGGTRRNIIAEEIKLEGTIRTFEPETYEHIKTRVREICSGIEKAYNCNINVNIRDDYPSVNNDKNLCEEFINAIGKEKIINLDPLMISEDFSYYQKEIPGLFFMLGTRNEEKGYVNALHNINFNFDEKILLNGLNTYIKLLKYKNIIK